MQGVVYLVVQGVVQGCGWLFLVCPPPTPPAFKRGLGPLEAAEITISNEAIVSNKAITNTTTIKQF